ncbi:type 1 glutamine amidotransferase domain-containing protein [Streptomyces sp. G1]|uniref:type 1 glutamine amidotransferase domain-containing protein n=1 Tax=Streptomyces sp. G1 TaxID=361572 RepID=UPI00202F3324|nr:type 1 glutamine amidotransferase domain-containing protein [Streptomyces sp. G1]MCM1966491.1 type 1 glutamine amidotransferase domain-containing protein [Streptomyces sp. G1]
MILFLLPAGDYDPTEAAVPWAALRDAGFEVRFATPDGKAAYADPRLTDLGFSWLSPWLMTRRAELAAYRSLIEDPRFLAPSSYKEVDPAVITGLFVPGGHAAGMRTLLEDATAQYLFARVFTQGLPVGAVCHGVLLAARAKDPVTGRSVLHGRRTTALTSLLELTGWNLTRLWLGRYYRTYRTTVQREVTAALADPAHFLAGPALPVRDTAARPGRGFTVKDGNYVSARWPGDCHRLAADYLALVREHVMS